jgi:hypothetical protein
MQRKNEVRKERIVKDLFQLKFLALLLIIGAIGALTWPKQVEAANLTLSWTDDSGGADGFVVERFIDDSGYAEIAVVEADVQSYTDSDLIGGTIYCYRIKAFNSEGDSDYSEEACATAPDTLTVPDAAILVSPSETITTQTPTYTWYAVEEATWYFLWVGDDYNVPTFAQWYSASEAGCDSSGDGTCSVTPDDALEAGEGAWWVQAWNDAGYGPWSDYLLFTIIPEL